MKDRSIQCFAGHYYWFVALAVFTLGVFAFGFPLGGLLLLRHIHDHKAVVLKDNVHLKEKDAHGMFLHNRQVTQEDYDR